MFRFSSIQSDYVTWQAKLAKVIGSTVEKGVMKIPEQYGKGYVYAQTVNDELSFVVMDIKMKVDFSFSRLKKKDNALVAYFNNVNISDFMKIRHGNHMIEEGKQHRQTIFLTSVDYDFDIWYSAGTHLKCVSVVFKEDIIEKFVQKNVWMYISEYIGKKFKNFNDIQLNLEMRQLLNVIIRLPKENEMAKLILTNRVLFLSEKFLFLFMIRQSTERVQPDSEELRRIEGIGKLLSNPNTIEFPSIEELSKMAMMSSASLKRKFKDVYGMQPYQLFRASRLEKARIMLESGLYSVKEIAITLGYRNSSNFSKEFKKQYGMLPSDTKLL